VPLADHERGPAGITENPGHGCGIGAQLHGEARKAGVTVADGCHTGHVVVEAGQEGGPRGRTHRIDVEVGVPQALSGQLVEVWGVDLGPVRAQVGKAKVVTQHHDHVW